VGKYGGTWRRAFTGPADFENADRLVSLDILEKDHPNALLHGHNRKNSKSRIYSIWQGMKSRCKHARRYAGKGIKVCPDWQDFLSFMHWAYANGYDDTKEIDRIDSNGNYTPDNCRWISRIENNHNRGCLVSLTIDGATKLLVDWASETGLARNTIYARYRRGITGVELIAPV
jgi:hypothetical protein